MEQKEQKRESNSTEIEQLSNQIEALQLDINQLDRSVQKLTEIKSRDYRWRYLIPVSLMRGLVTAIGATIVFAFVIYVASIVMAQLETFPLINDILEDLPWEEIIENSKDSTQ
ncbi:MAG: DUF5665 domain-containing protein [Candidatus Dojkabacteria bacterium]|nr:MAG: DUF5665 domain-containing protein [Candidatus Dojkabacteria bacterium]